MTTKNFNAKKMLMSTVAAVVFSFVFTTKKMLMSTVAAVVFSIVFTTNADARSSQNTQDTNTEVQETIMGIRV